VSVSSAVGDAQSLKTWEEVFATSRDYVVDRPPATTIANRTACRQLERFARVHDVLWPSHVSPRLMTELIDDTRNRLSAKTVNERLNKIRAIYRVAVGKQMLQTNPAQTTLGVKLPMHLQGRKKRLPFNESEVRTIFGSPVFTQHVRSRGQSGEASYWIPLIMYYTGARPEEIGGLNVDDVRRARRLAGTYTLPTFRRPKTSSCSRRVGDKKRNPARRSNPADYRVKFARGKRPKRGQYSQADSHAGASLRLDDASSSRWRKDGDNPSEGGNS
jgi:integrase